MRRLKGFIFLLALLAVGLVADWAGRAGAAGVINPPHVADRDGACPQPAVEPMLEWEAPYEETAPSELPSAEEPLRFDCGIGEAWRRHLP